MQSLSVKGKDLSIKVVPNSRYPQGVVTMALPIKVNPIILHMLLKGATSSCLYDTKLLDPTVVAYVAYQRLRNSLLASPLAMAQHKVTSMSCGANDTELIISAVCDKSITSLRKTAGTLLKGLRFSVLMQDYKKICATINVKPDTDAFNHAVGQCNTALDRNVSIAFTGKIKTDRDTLEKVLDVLENKVAEPKDKPKGQPRQLPNEECKYKYISIDADSPLSAILLHGYLEQYINGSFVIGPKVMYQEQYNTDVEKAMDKTKAERYVDKLMKLGDELSAVLSFQGGSQSMISPSGMKANERYTRAQLMKILA